MTVLEYLLERLAAHRLHMTLLDPEKQSPDSASHIAAEATEAGTDAIMVGGSTGVSQEILDSTVKSIKGSTELPVILFPTSSNALSPHADAIYFMSLLNSSNLKYVIREHRKGAIIIKKLGLEPIAMGYVVVAPGMKVGEVGQAEAIPRENVEETVGYALSAQYLGMKLVYLEAGSGAPLCVPPEMVSAVKSTVEIPLIVGGGIRDADTARELARSGADVIVTGTLVENVTDVRGVLTEIISAVRSIPRTSD